ncbi:MAG: Zn-dependent hydrolase [Marinilabiliales bacterium]|nr:MAG: Zn-dependent hydrolase [Marinilabiliales bacterium]
MKISMFVWKTSKNSSIQLIKVGITNCYLIKYDETTILVDTGQKRKSNILESRLSASLKGKRLDYIILTHTHYDHAENANALKELYSPELIVHESEVEFLRQGFTELPRGTNLITDLISRSGNKYARWIGEYEPVKENMEVSDNFKFDNSKNIKIIHTPGHTIGSISILIDDEIALVGDTLFGIIPNKVLPPFADHMKDLYDSWKKLLETPCEKYLPAHGRLITRELLEEKFKKLNY